MIENRKSTWKFLTLLGHIRPSFLILLEVHISQLGIIFVKHAEIQMIWHDQFQKFFELLKFNLYVFFYV
jgi:hypothetical protein